jgi:hypothetical protein
MLYSQTELGPGLTLGLSEYWPPYSQRDVNEPQRVPRETAGAPEGCGRPVSDGEEICHDLVRSRLRKLLSKEC